MFILHAGAVTLGLIETKAYININIYASILDVAIRAPKCASSLIVMVLRVSYNTNEGETMSCSQLARKGGDE